MTDQDGSAFRHSSGLIPPVPPDLSLPLQINLSAQILQINGQLYHSAPASPCCFKIVNSRAPLLPGHYPSSSLIRTHPPPSRLSIHFPLFTVIEPTLLQRFLSGTSRASPVARHVLVTLLSLPPRQSEWPYQSVFGYPCCLRLTVAGSASGASHFRGHLCVHFRYGPVTRSHPLRIALSMGFRYSVSLLPAIQATEFLILTLAGLTPAEHTSLSWTHNRTSGFPIHPALRLRQWDAL